MKLSVLPSWQTSCVVTSPEVSLIWVVARLLENSGIWRQKESIENFWSFYRIMYSVQKYSWGRRWTLSERGIICRQVWMGVWKLFFGLMARSVTRFLSLFLFLSALIEFMQLSLFGWGCQLTVLISLNLSLGVTVILSSSSCNGCFDAFHGIRLDWLTSKKLYGVLIAFTVINLVNVQFFRFLIQTISYLDVFQVILDVL